VTAAWLVQSGVDTRAQVRTFRGDAIEFLQELVRVTHPEEMARPKVIMQVTTERAGPTYKSTEGEYYLELTNTPKPGGTLASGRPPVILPGMPTPPPREIYLQAHMRGGPTGIAVYGCAPTEITKKQRQFEHAVVAHPQWTEADMTRYLEGTLGAKFGNSDRVAALSAQLPMKELSALLGTFRITKPLALTLRDRETPVGAWSMQGELANGGNAQTYMFTIEPYEGRIIVIDRF
jgi:hypothetical protein